MGPRAAPGCFAAKNRGLHLARGSDNAWPGQAHSLLQRQSPVEAKIFRQSRELSILPSDGTQSPKGKTTITNDFYGNPKLDWVNN
jgi:hypothetical protein